MMNPHKVPVTRSRSCAKNTDPNQSCPSVTIPARAQYRSQHVADAVVSPAGLILNPETRISRCSFIFTRHDSPQTLCFNFLPQCLLVQINSFSKTSNMKWKKKTQNDNNNSKKTNKKTITKQNTYAKIHRQCCGWGVDFIERTTEIVLLYLSCPVH